MGIVGWVAISWWLAALPALAATIEAGVKDEKGKAVDEAVVYLTSPPGTVAAQPKLATMDQWDKEFIPYVLAVGTGTPVNFPNRDNIRHHVYSFSSPKKFELPLYIGTPSSPLLFDKPGIVVLGCNIHDWMLAYVYVLTTPYFAKTGAEGRARIVDVPPGAYEVRVWHPRQKAASESTGQKVTLAQGGTGEASFVVSLKREWRPPRTTGKYDSQQQN